MGKRGHNEGSIYYDESNQLWYGSITLPSGRRAKTRGQPTRKAAREALDDLRAQQQRGVDVQAARQLAGHYLDAWVETADVKPRTRRSYRDTIRLRLKPSLERIELGALQPADVRAMMKRVERETSRAAALYARTVLAIALAEAERDGLVARNVARLVKVARPRRPEVQPLNKAQAADLLAAAEGRLDRRGRIARVRQGSVPPTPIDPRLRHLYALALGAGLRQGELLALRWADVDLDRGLLHVRATLGEDRERGTPKGGEARTVELRPPLVARLRDQWAQLQRERRAEGWQEHGLVFPSKVGTPIIRRNLHDHYKAVLAAAGLPPTVRFHDLRHTCAALHLSSGVPINIVARLLGHADVSTTYRHYGHLLPGAQGGQGAGLDDLLSA